MLRPLSGSCGCSLVKLTPHPSRSPRYECVELAVPWSPVTSSSCGLIIRRCAAFRHLLFKEVVLNMEPFSASGYDRVVGIFEYGNELLLYVKRLDHYQLVVDYHWVRLVFWRTVLTSNKLHWGAPRLIPVVKLRDNSVEWWKLREFVVFKTVIVHSPDIMVSMVMDRQWVPIVTVTGWIASLWRNLQIGLYVARVGSFHITST
jgi:hypothetical protein